MKTNEKKNTSAKKKLIPAVAMHNFRCNAFYCYLCLVYNEQRS